MLVSVFFRLSVHASVNVCFVARQVWAAAMVTTAADTVSISFSMLIYFCYTSNKRETQKTHCLFTLLPVPKQVRPSHLKKNRTIMMRKTSQGQYNLQLSTIVF